MILIYIGTLKTFNLQTPTQPTYKLLSTSRPIYVISFSPPKMVVPLHPSATFLYSRDGSDEVEKSKPHPSISPEVNERIDAGVAQSYEQEYCVDVAENMTKKG